MKIMKQEYVTADTCNWHAQHSVSINIDSWVKTDQIKKGGMT